MLIGLYPLVAWKIGNEFTFMAEGHSSDTGNVLEWASNIGQYVVSCVNVLSVCCQLWQCVVSYASVLSAVSV